MLDFENAHWGNKTTNVNFRLAPSHKARLIEKGSRLGLNISDYVCFALEKAERDEQQLTQLKTENARLHAALDVFQKTLEPLAAKAVGKEIGIGGSKQVVSDPAHLLQILVQNFKLHEK